MRFKRILNGVLVTAIAAAGAADSAQAATTIGSKLESTPDGYLCAHPMGTISCTDANSSLAAPFQASGGFVAPTSGVIVRWRLKFGASPVSSVTGSLRTLRGGMGVNTGELETIPHAMPGTHEFDARLPIQAGDRLGLDLTTTGVDFLTGLIAANSEAGAGDANRWVPPLADGATTSPTDTFSNVEVLLNADIESDADGDGFGDETQDQCSSDATTQGACASAAPPATSSPATPSLDKNAPAIVLSGKSSQKLGSSIVVNASCNEPCSVTGTGDVTTSKAKQSAKFKLKQGSLSLAANVKGKLTLQLSKKQRKKIKRALRRKRKATANVTIVAKDAAGNATTAKRKIKLKR
jgi:hypothetical protein